jgi:hypothetical protein
MYIGMLSYAGGILNERHYSRMNFLLYTFEVNDHVVAFIAVVFSGCNIVELRNLWEDAYYSLLPVLC